MRRNNKTIQHNIPGGERGKEAEEAGEGGPQHEEQDPLPEGEAGPHEARTHGLQDVAQEPAGRAQVSRIV